MSETIFRFRLKELTNVRLLCRAGKCNAALEVPLDQLAGMSGDLKCTACGTALQMAGDPLLTELAALLQKLEARGLAGVEFSLPSR